MSKVSVTEAAAEQLHNILLENQTTEETTLRLVPQPGGRLGIALDQQGAEDESIEAAGETVLVVAPDVAAMLDGSVIDVLETAQGPKLTITIDN
jgi:Fe-S cluster assembly iron-binding protein IscA